MSYTLKKLKQSEVDHGFRKAIVENNSKPTYGFFIAGFIVFLIVLLVLLKETQDLFNESAVLSAKHDVVEREKLSDANKLADKKLLHDSNEAKEILAEKKIIKLAMADKIQLSGPAKINAFIAESSINNQNDTDVLVKSSTNTLKPNNKQINKIELDSLNEDEYSETYEDESALYQEMNDVLNDDLELENNSSENVQNEFPKIKLNGVIFLDNGTNRYVLINMKKFYVDDMVDEDLSVEEIKQDSVVMRYKSKLFRLSMNE